MYGELVGEVYLKVGVGREGEGEKISCGGKERVGKEGKGDGW